jgi:predicted O-methyltransferase YrrM
MDKLKHLYKTFHPKYQKLILDYKMDMVPRYNEVPHKGLEKIINSHRDTYQVWLNNILQYKELQEIKFEASSADQDEPHWNNQFLPGLDIAMLYTLLREKNPVRYLEIGSGNSTKVARKAIKEGQLRTHITSVDPFPRATIDHLADTVIRKKLEEADVPSLIKELKSGDFLFIDNSHRSFPNSDVTVFFLDILPALEKGVIVQIHDIYLPFDYPQFMCDRFYNEQYLLAVALLSNPQKYRVIAPNYFISQDKDLGKVLEKWWAYPAMRGVERHGGSFWMEINQ